MFWIIFFVSILLMESVVVPIIVAKKQIEQSKKSQTFSKPVPEIKESIKDSEEEYEEDKEEPVKESVDEIVSPPDFDGVSVSELEELLTPDDSDVIDADIYKNEFEDASERDEINEFINSKYEAAS